eukprot:gene6903-biopygen17972
MAAPQAPQQRLTRGEQNNAAPQAPPGKTREQEVHVLHCVMRQPFCRCLCCAVRHLIATKHAARLHRPAAGLPHRPSLYQLPVPCYRRPPITTKLGRSHQHCQSTCLMVVGVCVVVGTPPNWTPVRGMQGWEKT